MKKFFTVITWLMCLPFMFLFLLIYIARIALVENRGITEVELRLYIERTYPHWVNVSWVFWLIIISILYAVRY